MRYCRPAADFDYDHSGLFIPYFRKGDICCRYGGEEFLMILPGSYYADTSAFAEKLRQQVKQMKIVYDGRKVDSFTISLGVASYPDNASSDEALIKLADDALYRAKAEGRDRVS
jgi:diguanylate cyclase (GGDEF)-like protein